jgi:hypothetical protein
LITNDDILAFIKKFLTQDKYYGKIVLTIDASKIKHVETKRGYTSDEIKGLIKMR